MEASNRCRIGLISDTHGQLRPEALAFLQGVDLIIHGGDIGNVAILETLAAIAPVTAVRGNNDDEAWADHLREIELLNVRSVGILAIHDLARMDSALMPSEIAVVVSGHSHKPKIERRASLIFINPGSAGPRRFKLPICIGELWVGPRSIDARIVELPDGRVLESL